MLSVCNSFSRICHVLVHFSSCEARDPFKGLPPAIEMFKTLAKIDHHFLFQFKYTNRHCKIVDKEFLILQEQNLMCLISGSKSVQQSCEHVAYHFRSCAFVLSPFSESPGHHNQNLISSFFSEEGFLPDKAAPRTLSLVRITTSES